MDQDAINRDLRERDSSTSVMQQKLLEELNSYIKASSSEMSKHWDSWDAMDKVYRGYRVPDKDDAKANETNDATKILIPITYAQTQTAISFILSMLLQREHFFEISPMGPEDQFPAEGMEVDLDYQVHKSKLLFKVYSWLLDSCKTGFGVVKPSWVTETARMRTRREQQLGGLMNAVAGMFGGEPKTEMIEEITEVTTYEGNQVLNVSPYSFYPDPEVPLAKFQEGAFVGHEEEVGRSILQADEGKVYHGTDKIPETYTMDLFDSRRRRVGAHWKDQTEAKSLNGIKSVKSVIFTEVQFRFHPKEWTKKTGFDFGDDEGPIKMVAVIANDSKIIRFEPLGYLHDQFTYSIIEYSPDHSRFHNPGLSETIYELQNLMTWFLNSHVVNVREVLQNRFIVDPTRIEVSDITSHKRYIRTKFSVGDINKAISQLNVADVTSGHVRDIESLSKIMQIVTGINDNALGQYSSGRRSATESRNVNAGAASRLKMHAMLMWYQGFDPLGRQMLSNTRQGRTKEVYDAILGTRIDKAPYERTILADPMKIAGGFDFMPFDGTMPSDKQMKAGVLTELFSVLIQNPETIQILGKDPTKLIHHIASLYNIHLDDFNLDANPQAQTPQAQVVPDAQAMEAAAQGAQSLDPMGSDLLQQLAGR